MGRGDLVGLTEGSRPQIGVVLAIDGKRITVSLGFQAQLQKLPARQLQLIATCTAAIKPDRLSAPPWQLTASALDAAAPKARQAAAAWLAQQQTTPDLPLLDWFRLIGVSSDPLRCCAWWLWLQGDQHWFGRHQDQVSARSSADVRRRRQAQRRQRLLQAAEQTWHQLLRRRQPFDVDALQPLQRGELELLLAWARGAAEQAGPLPPSLRQGLREADCAADPAAIRHLLVDLGRWDPHSLPALQHSPWAQGFSPELERLAEELITSADALREGDSQRVDRTSLRCFTIDDPDTEDLDDALGLETGPDGEQRLWIHIADPGRLIQAGDPLDLEARRRASSLYLARGILPMFPWALSRGPLSLRAGHRCAAWSLWVVLDADGAISRFGIERSWVKPAYRLSYGDADELIELAPPQEAELLRLEGLLQRRRQWRQTQGALLLDQPEGRLRCGSGSEPLLEICDPSASRLMVAEAMILAGAVIAHYGQSQGLALPYRSQLPGTLPPQTVLQALPPGPVRHAACKQGLGRGLTSASPAPHSSLGLQAYAQATSPIRRYSDLIVQRQLARQQQGAEPLSQAQVQELVAVLEDPLRQGQQISRDDQRHWRQVWFAQHRSQQWQALFLRWLRESDQLGLIWIEALAMELPAQCPATSQPADPLIAKVHRVDPLQDLLHLRAHR